MSKMPATVGQSCAGSNSLNDISYSLISRLSLLNMFAFTILGRYSDLNKSKSKSPIEVFKHGVVSNVCDFISLFSFKILNSSSFASPRLGPMRDIDRSFILYGSILARFYLDNRDIAVGE